MEATVLFPGNYCLPEAPADNFRAELEDGGWTIIEVGDGQVSGLAESDDPSRFTRRWLDARIAWTDEMRYARHDCSWV
ncbi:ATP-grasp domain-containing protein [Collinsella ihumii]|uniref:ATP-grasp domain-containing protein n=1 Tax=Collinsella ihumii TaxID=1720204 RepID=A0AAW7JRM0_9ACTN|nr:ATP-grasp domain-containing protein [Collinsella ihumii]MDN0070154.1 hypothetical protein [Collinsella ihumii]